MILNSYRGYVAKKRQWKYFDQSAVNDIYRDNVAEMLIVLDMLAFTD